MNIEEYRDFCLQKKGVTEGFPFDEKTLVFKVAGKMFALTDVDVFSYVNLKCDLERAIELRETYNGVKAGWHMNKRLWNSVSVEKDVPEELLLELITYSYNEIAKTLTKKLRDGL